MKKLRMFINVMHIVGTMLCIVYPFDGVPVIGLIGFVSIIIALIGRIGELVYLIKARLRERETSRLGLIIGINAAIALDNEKRTKKRDDKNEDDLRESH